MEAMANLPVIAKHCLSPKWKRNKFYTRINEFGRLKRDFIQTPGSGLPRSRVCVGDVFSIRFQRLLCGLPGLYHLTERYECNETQKCFPSSEETVNTGLLRFRGLIAIGCSSCCQNRMAYPELQRGKCILPSIIIRVVNSINLI
jgi:hypothetical protein